MHVGWDWGVGAGCQGRGTFGEQPFLSPRLQMRKLRLSKQTDFPKLHGLQAAELGFNLGLLTLRLILL